MRILSLDFDPLFGDDDDLHSRFDSDVSVFDFDVVFWDPSGSMRNYSYYDSYQGLPSLSDSESARLVADVTRRRAEFSDYVKSGRKLVVVARPPQAVFVATGEVRTSGTGRNAARTRIVDRLDLLSAIPLKGLTFNRASGNRISVNGKGPIQDHFRLYLKNLVYAATFTPAASTPIAVVSKTDRSVASVFRAEGGGVLAIIPETNFSPTWTGDEDDDEAEATWPDEATAYQESLLASLSALDGTVEYERPAWAEQFKTSGQIKVESDVAKQKAAVERARTKLSGLQLTLANLEKRDQLYLGSGRTLELQVREVLEKLGGTVSEPEPNRDDWRVDFDGQLAVVEVKGVSKSAAEKHAAQLEKWVAGSLADTGIVHKGILIVNTWRELPLHERSSEDFPAQMLPYCEGRNHVLITGLELFLIAAEIEADPSRVEFWRKQILETSGRISGVPERHVFIQQVTTNK